MIRFFHVSDLHFHSSAEHNRRVCRVLGAIHRDFFAGGGRTVLVVTGDVTDDGRREQYARAREALLGFGQVVVCPGNHDYGPAGVFYCPSSASLFDRELAHAHGAGEGYFGRPRPSVAFFGDEDGSRVMAIGLSAVRETMSPLDFSSGEVGQEQLGALDALLADPALRAVPKLVHLHFHPFMPKDPTMRLRDAGALLAVLGGRIQVLCFGHRHVEGAWWGRAGIPVILAAPAAAETRHVWSIGFEGGRLAYVERELIESLDPGRQPCPLFSSE
jgi:3',5'-cyclic AMP phosphodiesterase CpdA